MLYSEQQLINYTRSYDVRTFESEINQIIEIINDSLMSVHQATQVDCITNVEYFYIGSINNSTNVNVAEPIDLIVKINNPFLRELNQKYINTKSQKKKGSICSTPVIQLIVGSIIQKSLTAVTSVYHSGSYIFVDSLAELGKTFRIFIVTSSSLSGECYGVNYAKNTEFVYNLHKGFDNFEIKNTQTKGNFSNLVKITKNIAYENNLKLDSNVLESLLYNVPNKYFVGTFNEQIIKVMNYIKLSNYSNFTTIDESGLLTENGFYDISVYRLKKLIDALCQNFNSKI